MAEGEADDNREKTEALGRKPFPFLIRYALHVKRKKKSRSYSRPAWYLPELQTPRRAILRPLMRQGRRTTGLRRGEVGFKSCSSENSLACAHSIY
jgi:hypothetical protein